MCFECFGNLYGKTLSSKPWNASIHHFFFVSEVFEVAPPDSNKEATKSRSTMRIFVVTFSGRTLTHEVECSDTVDMLKDRIMDMDGIPANQQRLVFSGSPKRAWSQLFLQADFDGPGKQMCGDRSLSDYNIQVLMSAVFGEYLNSRFLVITFPFQKEATIYLMLHLRGGCWIFSISILITIMIALVMR